MEYNSFFGWLYTFWCKTQLVFEILLKKVVFSESNSCSSHVMQLYVLSIVYSRWHIWRDCLMFSWMKLLVFICCQNCRIFYYFLFLIKNNLKIGLLISNWYIYMFVYLMIYSTLWHCENCLYFWSNPLYSKSHHQLGVITFAKKLRSTNLLNGHKQINVSSIWYICVATLASFINNIAHFNSSKGYER